jgi:hypothetical protein
VIRAALASAVLLALAGCSAARIARDCEIAEPAADVASLFVPGVGLAARAVDKACEDPAQTARVLKEGEELAERLRDQR